MRSTFAGISATGSANVGIPMDGVTMNTGRHTHGLEDADFVNPDMIDEIRVVVAAVDVEGRGAAQIQMRARSGTNQFHGGLTWNVRNSALNANTWSNNRQGVPPIWYNRHQYTASLGGPIIKNKTFFFGLFDGQNGSQKENVDTMVLTDLARQGIFRFSRRQQRQCGCDRQRFGQYACRPCRRQAGQPAGLDPDTGRHRTVAKLQRFWRRVESRRSEPQAD